VEETCAATVGLAVGLTRVGLALGLEGVGLAVGFAKLDGGVLAEGAEVIVGVVDDVVAVVLAAVVREEAGLWW